MIPEPVVLSIRLPWPDAALSPNARTHWRKKAKLRASQRHCSFVEAYRQTRAEMVGQGMRGLKFAATLTFHAKDRRKRDLDNLGASMKGALDGVADALNFDDGQIARVTYCPAQDRVREPFVLLHLQELPGAPS